jgi:hypothetical protein
MSHNNGVMGWIKLVSKFESKGFPSNVDDNGVDDLNRTFTW